MRIAFCLYKYFPFGGLQRDFLRVALACQARGHAIRVYTLEWRGDIPAGFELVLVPVRALSNCRRYAKFSAWVAAHLHGDPADRLVGFNKMPGLDVYFAADPCYEDKARTLRNPLYRLSGRYRHFAAYERAVFGAESRTEILMISPLQMPLFQKYYGTPTRACTCCRRESPPTGGHRSTPRPSGPNSAASSVSRRTACCCCRSAPDSRPRGWTAA